MFDEPIKMDLKKFLKDGLKEETGHVVVLGYKNGRPEIDPRFLPSGFLLDPLGRKCFLRIFVGWSFEDAFDAYHFDVENRENEALLNRTERDIAAWSNIIYG